VRGARADVEVTLSDEHRALRDRLEAFARDHVDPLAAAEDDDPAGAYQTYRRLLGDEGVLAEMVTAEYGGARERLDLRALCIVREALAGASGLADLLFVMQGLGSFPVARVGSEALKREWLPRVARGDAIAAFAITEEHAGSDVAALRATAREEGDEYVLDGEKWFISNAGVADFYSVFATTDASAGRKGISCFLVEADRPGCSLVRQQPTLAPHPLGVVGFDGCRVPKGNRLGEAGSGFGLAMATLDMFRATVGAAALGMAERALREAIAFARERRQFGKALAEFQLTQAAIAEMAVEVDAARLLVYRAAWAHDRGDERVTLEASMAKLYATEAAQRVVDRSLQVHGGRGLLRGSVTERLYRDVRALRIYEGTSEIQKLVIASQLLRD
jgi:acyl-CoA dehydrogenase